MLDVSRMWAFLFEFLAKQERETTSKEENWRTLCLNVSSRHATKFKWWDFQHCNFPSLILTIGGRGRSTEGNDWLCLWESSPSDLYYLFRMPVADRFFVVAVAVALEGTFQVGSILVFLIIQENQQVMKNDLSTPDLFWSKITYYPGFCFLHVTNGCRSYGFMRTRFQIARSISRNSTAILPSDYNNHMNNSS